MKLPLILFFLLGLDDFNNTVLTVTFEADEDSEISELRAPILTLDDVINEANEQVLVIQLSLVSSLNPAGVDISTRSASLGRIIDNDRKYDMLMCYLFVQL